MAYLPDPDSVEAGQLVDTYLSLLRRTGWTNRQLYQEARYLGQAASHGWTASNPNGIAAIDRFEAWVRSERGLAMGLKIHRRL